MFSYCTCNPVNCIDLSGNMCYPYNEFYGGGAAGFSLIGFDPNGSFSSGGSLEDFDLHYAIFGSDEHIAKVANGAKNMRTGKNSIEFGANMVLAPCPTLLDDLCGIGLCTYGVVISAYGIALSIAGLLKE